MTEIPPAAEPISRSVELTPLLTSKLVPPPARPLLVPRLRLLRMLNGVLGHKLTLVSAQAGFGKTTLLTAWLQQADVQVAWLGLDKADDDLIQFWGYLLAALAPQLPGPPSIETLARSLPAVPLPAVLNTLLNRCASLTDDLVLVLDDYHVITGTAIHDGVGYLIDHLPPRLHVVIASRSDPPLPLARWRVRAQLLELHERELRFTVDESAAFLNDIMGLALAPAAIERLGERTEGWAAGLQLAALSLQGRSDQGRVIERFTGSDPYVFDYLVEEVLRQQPQHIRRFLLDTAILEQLSADLCAAVTGQPDAHTILTALERTNMFVVALDNKREWYRYHHLFADALRALLRQEERERINQLHLRASEWYEHHQRSAEAITHAAAAEHWEDVARLIEQFGGPLLAAGEWVVLLGWLNLVPEGMLHERPQLSLYYAWALVLTGRAEMVETRIDAIERHLRATWPDGTADQAHSPLNAWRGQLAAMRGYSAAQRGDIARAIEQSHVAMALLPEHDLIIRGVIALSLGTIYLSIGQIDQAVPFLAEARRASLAGGNLATAMSALGMLAQVHEEQAELERAAALYRQILADTSTQIQIMVHGHLRLALISYEWNDTEAALEQLQHAMSLAGQIGLPELLVLVDVALARLRATSGDVPRARELLQRSEEQAGAVQPLVAAYAAAQCARLRLLLGDGAAALRWAESYAAARVAEPGFMREFGDFTLARVQLAHGKARRVLDLLEPLMAGAEQHGRMARLIEMLVLQALALDALHDRPGALAVLARALTLAEPHRYMRTFLDEGPPLLALLDEATPTYARVILDAASERGNGGATNARSTAPPPARADIAEEPPANAHPDLVEPLSERELAVLRLIAAGHSNVEVAQALILAVGTVKKHVNNIYGKLGVHSRTQALARAHDLNLL